jgi:hypothetical protein
MPTDYSSVAPEKLLERRLDYAWKYFESASAKRMQFVNFYVLLVGVLANAYLLAINQNRYLVAAAVCAFAVLCSVTFMMLDHRMLVFVNRAISVLETLEREVLFPDGETRLGPGGRTSEQLGLTRSEPDVRHAGARFLGITTVKLWVRYFVMGGAGLLFAAAGIHAGLKAVGVM